MVKPAFLAAPQSQRMPVPKPAKARTAGIELPVRDQAGREPGKDHHRVQAEPRSRTGVPRCRGAKTDLSRNAISGRRCMIPATQQTDRLSTAAVRGRLGAEELRLGGL